LSNSKQEKDPLQDGLEFLATLKAKLERGEEPTPEERERFEEIAKALVAAFEPVLQALKETALIFLEAVQRIWDSLPAETQTALKQDVAEQEGLAARPNIQVQMEPMFPMAGQTQMLGDQY
jgi:hypothetical protein